MATTTAVSTTTTTPKSVSDKATFGKNFDQFLKLLVAQMQNQDPLNPTDSSQFTNQLVQFANVEQNIRSNSLLETISGGQTAGLMRDAANYVGKLVSVKSDTFSRNDTTSTSTFTYTNDKIYTSSKVNIYDATGKLVKSFDNLSGESGLKSITWDGKDNNGQAVPAGKFTLKASGTVRTGLGQGDESATNLTTTTTGLVNSAGVENGKIMLDVGGATVAEDNIISVLKS
jgi:flagellar basal-body rod modification protein FlgD